jgi:hypothetical protein
MDTFLNATAMTMASEGVTAGSRREGCEMDIDIEKLHASVENSSSQANSTWFVFLAFGTYLASVVATVSSEQLLLATSIYAIKIPTLPVELPLVAFFVAAPALFAVFHMYLLLLFSSLAEKAAQLNSRIEEQPSADLRQFHRSRIHPFPVTQMIIRGKDDRAWSRVSGAMVLFTAVIFPVVLLLVFQVRFLPYHDVAVTWWHRVLILADVAAIAWILSRTLRKSAPREIAVSEDLRASRSLQKQSPVHTTEQSEPFNADRQFATITSKGDPVQMIPGRVPLESSCLEIESVVLTPVRDTKSSAGRKPILVIMTIRMLMLKSVYKLVERRSRLDTLPAIARVGKLAALCSAGLIVFLSIFVATIPNELSEKFITTVMPLNVERDEWPDSPGSIQSMTARKVWWLTAFLFEGERDQRTHELSSLFARNLSLFEFSARQSDRNEAPFVSFVGRNLSHAFFYKGKLNGDFRGADLSGTQFFLYKSKRFNLWLLRIQQGF